MTESDPEAGITEALHDLSDSRRVLVRREIDGAFREIVGKSLRSAPAVALLTASGVCALFAADSAYRLSLRLLEKRLSPAGAASVAAAGYGVAAAYAGIVGGRWIREAPLPVPTETAKQAGKAVTDTAREPGNAVAESARNAGNAVTDTAREP
ncbi:MAG: phage holin family protein [Streptosporangiaceae bacterium]|nr:phage holin family protein [Streptosporangiaceae bacterium]